MSNCCMRRPAKFHVDSAVRVRGGGVKRPPPPVKRGLNLIRPCCAVRKDCSRFNIFRNRLQVFGDENILKRRANGRKIIAKNLAVENYLRFIS